ncbi:hypothetical protein SteCoe_11905 [Stentor coeruleus]|uniref:Uncharacterized protein n=1 Tax=Stentor coeruleus TaxID=5963 RepID=A0A1R2CC26_9CILI|nr:hypothetical protein SteCoe_11905 [Stentor coeruleus]
MKSSGFIIKDHKSRFLLPQLMSLTTRNIHTKPKIIRLRKTLEKNKVLVNPPISCRMALSEEPAKTLNIITENSENIKSYGNLVDKSVGTSTPVNLGFTKERKKGNVFLELITPSVKIDKVMHSAKPKAQSRDKRFIKVNSILTQNFTPKNDFKVLLSGKALKF